MIFACKAKLIIIKRKIQQLFQKNSRKKGKFSWSKDLPRIWKNSFSRNWTDKCCISQDIDIFPSFRKFWLVFISFILVDSNWYGLTYSLDSILNARLEFSVCIWLSIGDNENVENTPLAGIHRWKWLTERHNYPSWLVLDQFLRKNFASYETAGCRSISTDWLIMLVSFPYLKFGNFMFYTIIEIH